MTHPHPIFILALIPFLLAADAPDGPKSPAAKSALTRYAVEVRRIDDEAARAKAKAARDLIDTLKKAQADVLKAGGPAALAEGNAIQGEIDRANADFKHITAKIPQDAQAFQGRFYKLFKTRMTWDEARKYCEDRGGSLVMIHTKEEDRFVESLLGGTDAFFGLFRGVDGAWTWVDGSPVDYTNWMRGEPNNLKGIEKWGQVMGSRNGQWNDTINEPQPFIFSWESQP